jgi:hypothetical protein
MTRSWHDLALVPSGGVALLHNLLAAYASNTESGMLLPNLPLNDEACGA